MKMEASFSSTTPPMANADRRPSDDSYDSDSYFSKTYVPLSNLPTPPLSSHSDSSMGQYISEFNLDEGLEPTLIGPALHLRNLIPSSASLLDPSTHVVHSLLVSAALPLPTIALAVCILDSLNSRFALSWRRACPLEISDMPDSPRVHIDSVRPEVIILAALVISVKFLDDEVSPTWMYCVRWASERWSCSQINATEMCIMENLRYRILPLWTEQLIGEALEDMETAGRSLMGLARRATSQKNELELESAFSGQAIWSAEKQLTPVETPKAENVRGTVDVAPETKRAFRFASNDQDRALPQRIVGEAFPLYVEPNFYS